MWVRAFPPSALGDIRYPAPFAVKGYFRNNGGYPAIMPKRQPGRLLPREFLILEVLATAPAHGLALATAVEMPTSTVHNALVRLEVLGHVRSRWRIPKAKGERPRRVYSLTARGRRAI